MTFNYTWTIKLNFVVCLTEIELGFKFLDFTYSGYSKHDYKCCANPRFSWVSKWLRWFKLSLIYRLLVCAWKLWKVLSLAIYLTFIFLKKCIVIHLAQKLWKPAVHIFRISLFLLCIYCLLTISLGPSLEVALLHTLSRSELPFVQCQPHPTRPLTQLGRG